MNYLHIMFGDESLGVFKDNMYGGYHDPRPERIQRKHMWDSYRTFNYWLPYY